MKPRTAKVAALYGAWVLSWICIASYGALFNHHGEFGVSAHLWLTLTGLPLSFISWALRPHGTVPGGIVAGVAGLIQWGAIAEVCARWDDRKKSRNQS